MTAQVQTTTTQVQVEASISNPSKRPTVTKDNTASRPHARKDTNTFEHDSTVHLLTYLGGGALIRVACYAYSTGIFGEYGGVIFCSLLLTLLPRMDICTHEAFHYKPGDRLNFFMRYQIFSPEIYFHYDLYREEHFTHHNHMSTSRDKNFFLISGSPIQGLIQAFVHPEHRLGDIIQERHPNTVRHLLLHWILKFVLCGTEMYIVGAKFWFVSFYIPYRIVQGLAFFLFFYVVHNDSLLSTNPKKGVYNLNLPPALQQLLLIVWGEEVVDALCYHAAHHTVGQWSIRADKLPEQSFDGPFTVAKT